MSALGTADSALDESPDVRLTTNIVGCEPDDVHIGQEVDVRFEQHDGVFLPLFEPTGTTRENPVVEPELPAPRPAPGVWHLVSSVAGTLAGVTRIAALSRKNVVSRTPSASRSRSSWAISSRREGSARTARMVWG
mgnify:CR=1 FL=1